MISGYIIGDKEVARRFRALPDGIRSRVTDAIGRIALRLQRKVMQEKLSGQVLKVRTGTLRRSIDQRMVTDSNVVTGIVSTNLKYARAHEYGCKDTVTVKEHLRLVKKAFGKELKSPVWSTVKTHEMHMKPEKRSFLRSALEDMQKDIVADINKAAGEGVRGK